MPPACCGEVFMSVFGWWSRYESTQQLYMPTPPVLSYCADRYKSFPDDKERGRMIDRVENAFMTMAYFSAARQNGNSSHSFCNVQFDQDRGRILNLLPAGLIEYVEILSLQDSIQHLDYAPVWCLLALRSSEDTYFSRYGGSDHAVFWL